MRVLILGCSGILGHVLFLYLKAFANLEVIGICSENSRRLRFCQKFSNSIVFLDLANFVKLSEVVNEIRPHFVINCSVKKNLIGDKIIDSIFVNSILPHKISDLAISNNFRFIHISTDSVFGDNFEGKLETDSIEIKDLYSASKVLGEPLGPKSVVIRTSIVGHSLTGEVGFLDSVRSVKTYHGYSLVLFAGTTVLELSKIIYRMITDDEILNGIYHVKGKKISKYSLAELISKVYNLNLTLVHNDQVSSKRLLSSLKFDRRFCYSSPEWGLLLEELKIFYYLNIDVYEERTFR
jgi:dTDP-4-dehydrorhamnose reductase